MAGRSYHGIRARLAALALACLMALAAGAARGETLTVGDLSLDYAAPWQRGDAREEAESASLILLHGAGEAALTVRLPDHQVRLRHSEARFRERLERQWRERQGAAVEVRQVELAGLDWLMARYPSQEREGRVVFHLVTVLDGRVHHLLAQAPAAERDLPEPLRSLLSAARTAAAEPAAVSPEAGPPASRAWRLERVIVARPDAVRLGMLAGREAALLPGGLVTGYALSPRELGFGGFLEGYVWVAGEEGRPARRPMARRWDVAWDAPPEVWPVGTPLSLTARVGPDTRVAPDGRLGLRLTLAPLCGSETALREAWRRMAAGEAAPALDCPESAAPAVAEAALAGDAAPPGDLVLSLPAAAPPPTPAGDGLARRLLLSARAFGTESGQGWGDSLLGAVAVHYIYAPGEGP